MDDLLVGERLLQRGGLHGVDVADQVGDRDVGRRELLPVARVAREPLDGEVVARARGHPAPVRRERREGGLVQLRAGDDRQLLVEEVHEGAEDPRLRLPAQAEQDHVVPREQRVDEGRDDGPLVAEDAGEDRSPSP